MADHDSLAAAFAAALADMTNLRPDAKSNRGGYVSLSALLEACRPILAKHGLAVFQQTRSHDGELQVQTVVVGAGGMFQSGWLGIAPKEAGGQAAGAALTFMRRFSLQAFLAITGGDDDAVVPRGQVAELGAAFNRAGLGKRDDRLAFVSRTLGRDVESSKELTEAEADTVLAALREMRP